MNLTDPIRRVSVVSTGRVRICSDHVASNGRATFWWLLASRRGLKARAGRPQACRGYAVEHARPGSTSTRATRPPRAA